MKKHFLILVAFVMFILGNCSTIPDQKNEITIDDFEIVSIDIYDPAGGQFSYSLLTLTASGISRWKDLNIFLNDLLYDGLSVTEYLNKEKGQIQNNLQYNEKSIHDVWALRGELLSIKRETVEDYGRGGGNSNSYIYTYIINVNTLEQLSVEDIVNVGDEALEHLLQSQLWRAGEWYADYDISGHEYDIFFDEMGIGFIWHGITKHPFEILIPYLLVGYYLTPLGQKQLLVWPSDIES